MDERDQHQRHDPQHRAEARPLHRLAHGGPEGEVAEEEQEEEEREGEPRVPGPPGAPDRLAPDRAGGEHHRRERQAHLRARLGEEVEPRVVQPEVEEAGHADQDERDERAPRRRRVHVEDLLGHPLARLHRRVPQRQEVDHGHAEQAEDRQEAAVPDDRGGGGQRHSSTTAVKASVHSVTNTTS